MSRAARGNEKREKRQSMKNKALVVIDLQNGITEFFLAGADAAACVKSTSYNMAKAGYTVHVLSDCITSYDKKKLDGLLRYYADKGCAVETLREAMEKENA